MTWQWAIVLGYFTALSVITVFSLEQLYLAITYLRRQKKKEPDLALTEYPKVTIQLPVFNEKYVIIRLIRAVCQIDYPLDKLEIQVLDDSTDESFQIADDEVQAWKEKGLDIQHIKRPHRVGFKAGALQYGLNISKGEYVAIFDADFLPGKDFLLKTLPHFEPLTGMVQSRWTHLNEDYSHLTRMQAFGLNAHFTVEQGGRNLSGKFINFNGTAGVWRKACIYDAGGWQSDTLTEDLDLSYRAQMNGWKFKYREEITSPAELPVLVPAIKSQQYRWNKGAAEVARKNLKKVLAAKLGLGVKWHAMLHLLNSSVFIFMLLASLLSVPMLVIQHQNQSWNGLFNMSIIFIIGFIGMAVFYLVAYRSIGAFSWRGYLINFLMFLTLSMGMTLYNAIAVFEGYIGRKTPFVRTPKFNITNKGDSWKTNQYIKYKASPINLLEGLLSLYFGIGVAYAFYTQNFGLILFHLMLSIGFGAVAWLTYRSTRMTNAAA